MLDISVFLVILKNLLTRLIIKFYWKVWSLWYAIISLESYYHIFGKCFPNHLLLAWHWYLSIRLWFSNFIITADLRHFLIDFNYFRIDQPGSCNGITEHGQSEAAKNVSMQRTIVLKSRFIYKVVQSPAIQIGSFQNENLSHYISQKLKMYMKCNWTVHEKR